MCPSAGLCGEINLYPNTSKADQNDANLEVINLSLSRAV